MDWFRHFSAEYADGVTAIGAFGTLVLATFTLWYLKREYQSRYRPYVVPVVHAEPKQETLGYDVSIIPRNVGQHPCQFQITQIRLQIGDEIYQTPDTTEWSLLGPHGADIHMPVGHINEQGIRKIRDRMYKNNRVELTFVMTTTSMEAKYRESKSFAFEIGVDGETPQVLFRPEWKRDA